MGGNFLQKLENWDLDWSIGEGIKGKKGKREIGVLKKQLFLFCFPD